MEDPATSDEGHGTPIDSGSVTLRDGRSIGWTAWGAPDGATVIDQPHLGDSGQTVLAIDIAPLRAAGIRLVIACRAGLGRSTRHPGRNEQSDAEDMLQIIDALSLDRAYLLGECGGTGATLALAARWPDRVKGVALVSPMAPLAGRDADAYLSDGLRMMRRYLRVGLIGRWMARVQARAFGRDPLGYLDRSWKPLPAADRVFVEDPVRCAHALAVMSDFFASPARFFDEWRAVVGPWTIDLASIRAPILIEHGELDVSAPVAMARWLSDRLPTARVRIDPERGHFMATDRIADVLQTLVGLGKA